MIHKLVSSRGGALLGLLALAATGLLVAGSAHADSTPVISSIATQGCANDRVAVTLTVDNPVAGTITLKLTGHTPGSSVFVDTGAELSFTIVPGTTTYTRAFEDVASFIEPDFNTLRVEFKSSDIANLGGTTTKSVSFSPCTSPSDHDLAFTAVPPDITTDATSPAGAPVSYTNPAASDESLSTVTVSCLPASGSMFKIGDTTVTCTATDSDGDTNSGVQTKFNVHVKGAEEQLTDLAGESKGVGPGTSLADKVSSIQSSLGAGDTRDACGTLNAFIHEVKAQTGVHIPSGTAATLITDAQRIEAVIPCTS